MKTLLAICIIGTVWMLIDRRLDSAYQRGYADATQKLLHVTPPSEELEIVCAGLWMGEQNKKYWNKENASRVK